MEDPADISDIEMEETWLGWPGQIHRRTVTADDATREIRTHYQPRRAMPEHHWLLRWIIEVAAVTIALTMTAAMTVFAYPVLTEMIGAWGIIVSTVVGLGFGIVVTWCALQLINH